MTQSKAQNANLVAISDQNSLLLDTMPQYRGPSTNSVAITYAPWTWVQLIDDAIARFCYHQVQNGLRMLTENIQNLTHFLICIVQETTCGAQYAPTAQECKDTGDMLGHTVNTHHEGSWYHV